MFRRIAIVAFIVMIAAPAWASPDAVGEDCDTPLLRQNVQAGDKTVRIDLATCLMASKSDDKQAEARRLFKAVMDDGDAEGKNGYAIMLLDGVGGQKDVKLGQKLQEEAAAEGSYGAQLTLAEHYLRGGGFYPQDKAKGLALLTQVADGGKVTGVSKGWVEWRIAMMHLKGQGTEANSKIAYLWVTRSADHEYEDGMISRAVMLATADGVAEDDVSARDWYQKAINLKGKSLAHALRGLGFMIWTGEGGPQDLERACTLIYAALELGDENARVLLKDKGWEQQLSEQRRKACQKSANQWMKENLNI
jgi:TPR repeat protein